MTADPLFEPLPEPPRRPDGTVDLDTIVDRLRSRWPVHVLEDAQHDDSWSYAVPSSGSMLLYARDRARMRGDGQEWPLPADPLAALDQTIERLQVDLGERPPPGLPPFTGGLVGHIGYDLARRIESLPTVAADDRRFPMLALHVAPIAIAVRGGDAHVIARDLPLGRRVDASQVREALRGPSRSPRAQQGTQTTALTASLPRDEYLRGIEEVLERIAAGDVYQVNLTQRLTGRWTGDAHGLYRAMRRRSPAPHGAVIETAGGGIASISPETFLRIRGEEITTRPIKGTRPRAGEHEADVRLREELAASEKDRAENVMVVDMERNDLGRVCRPGSVRTPHLLTVERHPTVWHLVSTVTGRLRSDATVGAVLRATFPSGSVTGAPKIAAMRLIEQLEPVRRGVYCGAIGYVSVGAVDLSVAIRTATLHASGEADYGAGGGIVADSDPDEEYEESLAKAAAFLASLGGDRPSGQRSASGEVRAGLD